MKLTRNTITAVATAVAGLIAMPALAAGSTAATTNLPDKVKAAAVPDKAADLAHPDHSDRALMSAWTREQEALRSVLVPGQTKAWYMQHLALSGHTLTSINADTKDYLEYETVKGAHSFEVQIDLDRSGKGEKIAIEPNIWRADTTTRAMRGTKVPVATSYMPDNARYSDRARMGHWLSEKDTLAQSLPLGKEMGYYARALKQRGYQVTATNDLDKGYLEYEIVKGQDSYEVQIDLNGAGKATNLNITTNLWLADATEKALEKASR